MIAQIVKKANQLAGEPANRQTGRQRRGQSILEYAIILSIVALALGMMQVYIRRGVQAGIKIAADEIGLQEDFGDYFEPTDFAEDIEESKETIKQDTQLRRKVDSSSSVEYGQEGAAVVNVDETNTVIELKEGGPSYSKSWSNWRADDE